MENSIEKNRLLKIAFVFGVILIAYFAVKTLAELRNYNSGGKEPSIITLSGHGEVKAVPDIATISFTISKDAKTAKEAQAQVALIETKALDVVKKDGITEKDIKATDSSVYPKYDYKQQICPPVSMMEGAQGGASSSYYCGGKQVLTGYTASVSITVKVRKVDDAAKVMEDLGAAGVSNLNGPNFTIDDEDALKAAARKEAIADAKTKAEVLAKDLGVRLVKITSFSENSNYPMPMYAKDMMANQASGAEANRLTLPTGENTITSDVSITYEIR